MTLPFSSVPGIAKSNTKNAEAKDIGKLKNLMVDWNTGKASHAVLSYGGCLLYGDKYFAIPLEQSEINARNL